LLVSGGLWLGQGAWWIGLVLLVLFTCTSSMMSLTEAAMAHLVAGDWGRYGRVRLWGSVGFMCTVFAAGAWFESRGMQDFPAWTAVTLSGVLLCTWWLPDVREKHAHEAAVAAPVGPVLRQPAVRWFFATLLLPRDGALFDLWLPVAVPGFAGLQQGHDRHALGGVGAG
jgi:PPP family 3-phenylpropionic acid transporter